MPPKSTKSTVSQKDKVSKKVVKKEETSSDSESEQEQVKIVKKTVVSKKKLQKDSESEQEQEHKEMEQKDTNWSAELSDNEIKPIEPNEPIEQIKQTENNENIVDIQPNQMKEQKFNNRSRNDKRFNSRNVNRQCREPNGNKNNVDNTNQTKPENQEKTNSARYNMKTGNRVNTRINTTINKTSMALKFSYNDYENIANPVMEVSSEDLLKVLIARSYKEGKMTLKRSLEYVLRAMNHECNFPISE